MLILQICLLCTVLGCSRKGIVTQMSRFLRLLRSQGSKPVCYYKISRQITVSKSLSIISNLARCILLFKESSRTAILLAFPRIRMQEAERFDYLRGCNSLMSWSNSPHSLHSLVDTPCRSWPWQEVLREV